MFLLGIENFIRDKKNIESCKGQRLALLVHAASTDQNLNHSLDLIANTNSLNLSCVLGPQHGLKSDLQDNMMETSHDVHPKYKIPIYSLYSKIRKPSKEILQSFDTLLVDLQDVGCRVYTYLTTLFYMIEACEKENKRIVILDRPNPAGRPIEGFILNMDFESFIGAAPLPLRHGLTLGEAACWYKDYKKLNIEIEVIKMSSYNISNEPWPKELTWVNPSPNLPRLSSVQAYSGTVLLEGTELSEGRGTTRPLEIVGAPDLDFNEIYNEMKRLQPDWLKSCIVRPCYFKPQFQKYSQKLCSGLQIHTDTKNYNSSNFRPQRLIALTLKSIRSLYPDYNLWKNPPYEYETIKKPFDILSGSEELRNWVDESSKTFEDLDKSLRKNEELWKIQCKSYYLY